MKADLSDHVDRAAAAQRRDDIESALRLFAGSGNLSVDVFVREISQSFTLEVSDVVLAKDLLALLAKQLKGRPIPGFQQVCSPSVSLTTPVFFLPSLVLQEDIRLRDYGLICRPKEASAGDGFGLHIRLDDQIRNFVNKGKIERMPSFQRSFFSFDLFFLYSSVLRLQLHLKIEIENSSPLKAESHFVYLAVSSEATVVL